MQRLLPLFALALVCAGIAVGCGKKEEPEPGAGGAPEPAEDKRAAAERLQQIAKAVIESEKVYATLPTGCVSSDGRFGLSWRVVIFPFLGADDLYKEFKIFEPWDSEDNKKLIARMPKVFETGAPPGQTHIRSFAGPLAVTPWHQPPAGRFSRGRSVLGLSDGSIYTLFAAEAAEPVVWTKPDEMDFADKRGSPPQSLPKLGGRFAGGFHGLMCDGRVLFFPDSLGEAEVRKLITADAGDVPGPELTAMLAYPAKAADADKTGKGDPKGGKGGVWTDVTDASGKVIGKKKTQK